MCINESGQFACVAEGEECKIKLPFKFEENEDNQNCFWSYFRFEDKFYSHQDMSSFLYKVREKHGDAYIGIDDAYRFSIANLDKKQTGKDLWFLASESTMSTFGIPK